MVTGTMGRFWVEQRDQRERKKSRLLNKHNRTFGWWALSNASLLVHVLIPSTISSAPDSDWITSSFTMVLDSIYDRRLCSSYQLLCGCENVYPSGLKTKASWSSSYCSHSTARLLNSDLVSVSCSPYIDVEEEVLLEISFRMIWKEAKAMTDVYAWFLAAVLLSRRYWGCFYSDWIDWVLVQSCFLSWIWCGITQVTSFKLPVFFSSRIQ
jgi:hypothetical protein